MSDLEEVVVLDAKAGDQEGTEEQVSAEEHARLRGDFLESDDTSEELTPEPKTEQKAEEKIPDGEDAVESRKGQISIPKARFDEVNARMKQAEQELEALRAKQYNGKVDADSEGDGNAQESQAITSLKDLSKDIAAKTRQAMDALIDGDEELYERISSEIEDARARQVEIKATEIAEHTVNETRKRADAQREYDAAVKHAEKIASEYPFLGENGDTDAIETFALLRDNALTKGMSRIESMDSALAKVAKMYGYEVDSNKPGKADAVKSNLLRKEAMAARQPPRVGGVGNRAAGSTVPTKIEQMSDDDFAKLTQREKKALRGDDL